MNLSWIKKVYLYLVSLISLVILVIAGIMLINLALTTWVFPKADSDYYYPDRLVCNTTVEPNGGTNGEVVVPQDPRCDDPNWEEKEMQRQKDSRTAQKQRNASQAIAMIIIAAPVFYYHWKLARKES